MAGGDSEDPDDRPAGLPSERSNKLVLVIAIGALAVPFFGLIGWAIWHGASARFAETLSEVDVPGLDHPVEAKLELAAGTPLLFALATGYSYSGNPVVHLDVSLQRDGVEVAKQDCNMKGFTGIGSSGSGANTWYGDAGWQCTLDVPDGGANLLRLGVRKAGTGSLELDHTSVLVKRR